MSKAHTHAPFWYDHVFMQSAESSGVAKVGQDMASWILNHALGGIGKLSSASDLADEYRRMPYPNDAERVQAVIRSAVAKNAATGFVTGLGGMLTLPVAIPTSLAASLAIQARMVAAIAEIYGHDSGDDQVQTAILLCMVGTAMEDVVKQAGVTLGGKAAIEALKKVPGKVLIDINRRIGFRLVTKFGEKGVVTLAKLVPLVGGAVGGAFDGATCYVVGQAADRAFRPATAEQAADAETWERALDTYRYPVDLTRFGDAHEHRGWFDRRIDPGGVPQTVDFETRFRAKAQDHLEAWGEVVFWKLYSGGQGLATKRAAALLGSGVLAADLWSSVADYVAEPNLDSFRVFRTMLFTQPVVATAAEVYPNVVDRGVRQVAYPSV